MRRTHTRIHRIAPSLILLAALAATCASAQESPEGISYAARTYLEQALDLMQQNALNKSSIDWPNLRTETLARASHAKTTVDTYPAITFALTQLKEHHSFLQLPDNLPAPQREAITAEINKVRAPSDSDANQSPFAPQKEMQGHLDRRGGKIFAHVVVPMCVAKYAEWEKNAGDFQEFAEKLHSIVMDLQAQKPDGWLIDLRGNRGGNMWPMLAGIGAVLGEGDLGTFESADGERVPWFYKAGKAGTRDSKGQVEIAAHVEKPLFALPELPWVAVLLDRSTGSSGEAVAISFTGRPRARSFGEHTAGFSTSNQRYPLSDGAALFLCVGIEADRTGHRYPDGLDPDVQLPAPDSRPTEEKDAVLQTAEDWIAGQASAPSSRTPHLM
jgi:carboxyl-terminal processing protease